MAVAVIGCGVMGQAFAKHWIRNRPVIVCDRDREKTQAFAQEIGATFEEQIEVAIKKAEVVLLAVKPKDLNEIAKLSNGSFSKEKILLSILAGTPLAHLKKSFPKATVIRTMPNLALICGEGVIGIAEDEQEPYSDQVKKVVNSLLHGMGLSAWMSEGKLEALTAISGSGIGFVLVMLEAMIDGGVHLGFTATESREFAMKTMEGAVALMRESGKHPAELKLHISSPGGTTIAGLKVMEERGVRSGIIHTLIASYEKALHMMKEK